MAAEYLHIPNKIPKLHIIYQRFLFQRLPKNTKIGISGKFPLKTCLKKSLISTSMDLIGLTYICRFYRTIKIKFSDLNGSTLIRFKTCWFKFSASLKRHVSTANRISSR